jgi:hypothetical protein
MLKDVASLGIEPSMRYQAMMLLTPYEVCTWSARLRKGISTITSPGVYDNRRVV